MTQPERALSSIDTMILDRNSEYWGVSTLQLMENAGRAVADEVTARFGKGSEVAIYGGTGRNGGDGMVAARHLAGKGFKVTYKLIGNQKAISDSTTLQNWIALKAMDGTVKIEQYSDSSSISEANTDVIVDALLGTGTKGKLRQPTLRAVQVINASRGFKMSIDVPTGIDSDTGEVLGEAVHANLTVSMHSEKRGFSIAAKFCGEVKVADIGIPEKATTYAGPGDVAAVVTVRQPDAHKGEFGRLLVVGGSEVFTGAPTLVSMAAYRTGTDLVFTAAPERTAQAIASMSPNLITIKLPGDNFGMAHVRILREHLEKASALAIGPGIGMEKQTVTAVRKLVALAIQRRKPFVLDADALKAMGVMRKRIFDGRTVVTPHAGEYQAISGKTPPKDLKLRSDQVREFASRSGSVVLLKGHIDVVSDGVRTKLNATGNPGMTVGGTGDVLTGLVAGLLAQGADPFRAAVAGAFACGAAGDLAERKLGDHLTPTDLIDYIPTVIMDPMCHREIQHERIEKL